MDIFGRIAETRKQDIFDRVAAKKVGMLAQMNEGIEDPKERQQITEKAGRTAALSRMLGIEPDLVYDDEEEIKKQIKTMIRQDPTPIVKQDNKTRSFEFGYKDAINMVADRAAPTLKKALYGLSWAVGESMIADSQGPGLEKLKKDAELFNIEIDDKTIQEGLNYKVGKALAVWGKSGSEKIDKELKDIINQLPPEMKGRLWDNPELLLNPKWDIVNLGDVAISLVPVVAATLVGGPAAGGVAGGSMEGADLYEQLRREGVTHDNAVQAATAFGVVSGILNAIGMEKVFGKEAIAKGVASRIKQFLVKGSWEAGTEYAEEPFQAAFKGIAEEKQIGEITRDVVESLKNVEVLPGSFVFGGSLGIMAPNSIEEDIKNTDTFEHETIEEPPLVTEEIGKVLPIEAAMEVPIEMEEKQLTIEYKSPVLTKIRKAGGINPELSQGEAQRFTKKESRTTGLISKNGVSPDTMREMLQEGGGLPEGSTINDLWNLMDSERNNELTKRIELIKTTKPNQDLIVRAKSLQTEKGLSGVTVSRLRKFLGIENIKTAEISQLEKLVSYLEKLEPGDSYLSELQIKGLKDLIGDLPEIQIIPKRIVIDTLGEKTDILPTGIEGKIIKELIPTVDIKEGHPLVKHVTNKADDRLGEAYENTRNRDKRFDELVAKAEKSRGLPIGETIKRTLVVQNKEIFAALGGKEVNLTKEERAVVAYLKNFFKIARIDLELDKYRKRYVTHIEQPLMEAILDKGLYKGIEQFAKWGSKETDIPLNIMLELDNIIGTEKFFRFALERKGGVHPSTNLRNILHVYSNLYETKKALDEVLPEGNVITKLLLQKRSAQWMKRYLQNLKGRGLDHNFRTSEMAWLAKIADVLVDIGYLKLLGLNYSSALKNLIAGEANSFIMQDFFSYMEGKQRFAQNPKRVIELATEHGILDGLFYEYAQKGIGKLKGLQNFVMIGQKAGEYEIRSSIFAGELTEEEFKTGKILDYRIREIKDLVAITQGRFSKTDSPLFIQTWYGRMFMQMNRWRITNGMMLIRLAKGARREIAAGEFMGKNMRSLGKAFIVYGIGMYLQYELGKAGYKKASRIAQSMAELINSTIELVGGFGPIVNIITENPTYSILSQASYSIRKLAYYIAPALIREPQRVRMQEGIEETYVAPIDTLEDIFDDEDNW